jgi:hypothetical protein
VKQLVDDIAEDTHLLDSFGVAGCRGGAAAPSLPRQAKYARA